VRTIRDVARHVLELEVYYRSGLRDGPAAGIFEPVGAPAEEHAARSAAARTGRGRTVTELLAGQTGAERAREWTVRKVLARLISHERVHTAEIWQRRAWVLLGAPGSPDV
jgi:hypothetical protein